MVPSRRVTERMSQLVDSVARSCLHPCPLPGWVGGIWWPRQGHHWWNTHAHTERDTTGLGATQAGSTITVGDTVSPSFWQRRGCVYVCMYAGDPTLGVPPPSWECRWLLAIPSSGWLHCCLSSSKLVRFTSACSHSTCTHTEPTGGRPCSTQQAGFKG